MASFSDDFSSDTTGDWEQWQSDHSNSIVSEKFRLNCTADYKVGCAVNTANALTSDDQYVWFELTNFDGQGFGAIVRAPGSSGDHYQARYSGGEFRVELISGSGSFLSAITVSTSGSFTQAKGDWYGLKLEGADQDILLSVWQWSSDPGTPDGWGAADSTAGVTGTPTTITGNYYTGLRTYTDAPSKNNNPAYVEYDNFNASDAGAGEQTVSADYISSGSATFEPSLTPGSVTRTADFIGSGSALYEPTLTPGTVTRTADFIGSGSALYEPTLTPGTVTRTADFIGSGSATYEPVLSAGNVLLVDFIASGSALYEPTLTPGSVTRTADFIGSGSALYEPTITPGLVTRTADFISSGSATYEPTLTPGSVTLSADFISSGSTTYEPVLVTGNTLLADFISSGSATYEPTLSPGSVTRTADFISSGSALYEPTLSILVPGEINADFIPSGSATYEPTLSPGSVTRTLDFIGSGSAIYAPTLSSTYTLTVDFIASGSALYEPTLSPGTVTASIDFISSGSALFEPTLTTASLQQIDLDFIASGSALYEPSVTTDQEEPGKPPPTRKILGGSGMRGKTFWDDIEDFTEARLRIDDEDIIAIITVASIEGRL